MILLEITSAVISLFSLWPDHIASHLFNFSLSIILWEMWYGQDAADHISCHLFGRLDEAVKAGLRPSVTMTCKPPDDWIALMQSGWDLDPAKRPYSRDILEFFENFLRKNRR